MTSEILIPEILVWKNDYVMLKQRYEFVARLCGGLRVLDAACGVGYGSKIIAEAGASHVTGADQSETAIQVASMKAAHPCVQYVRANLAWPESLGRPFDVVVSFDTLEHLADPESFMRGLRRILPPNGLLICGTPNRNYRGRASAENPYKLSELTHSEFVSLFERHFHIGRQYHQSPSHAYTRHCLLVRELEDAQFQLKSSRVMEMEKAARKACGRYDWAEPSFSSDLQRAVPGDYVIEAFDEASTYHQEYILTGTPRAGE